MSGFDAAAFQAETGVSRETLDRLAAYDATLRKWQPKINLVGPSTLPDAWRRHFLDSAQLFPLIPESARVLVDLGSGAGFPGLVLAIMGVPEVHLVESDARKCAFLREAARAANAKITVHNKRIEAVTGIEADVVTARALAPLSELLAWAHPFIGNRGATLFPKGQNVAEELTDTTKYWKMRTERFDSRTDPTGTILRVSGIDRV
ncbi:16S rRNA (guanine(527)-N(7))-methyltransferase RsmG [Azospirillum rugosum]|uniref:Ribosomal RNA small subunit methyltransferase G n=1 Tax=Azospirillum rugosum TaxID=416170 RepID=A0ABS4SMW6_9PROT|nr:16S rRNA (guanine(527)-N(7))-methyltransferase RsmG [Azospirillum rugosum]MBP2293885.1 16S rRNA (guanine527-N7)-methyltransferase [Azospirillum rugosum]MDQ0526928.1 16S rRNA (guanine527-N7)-methyltransferase [Azospirillum rugosum]